MKALGKDARALLDAAAGVDAAPHAIRLRARRRLVSALSVGGVMSSAIVAKGASVGASGTAAVGSASSLAATLVSAVVVGLSTGLVALSPTSKQVDFSPVVSTPTTEVSVRARALPQAKSPSLIESPKPEQTETLATTQQASTPARRSAVAKMAPQPDGSVVEQLEATPHLDAIAPPKPNKASIARETELLSEAQRALKGGHALLALATLDRYTEECPARMLNEEATASRIVALCALGRISEGQQLTAAFLSHYPDSPLFSRVRGACPMRLETTIPSAGTH